MPNCGVSIAIIVGAGTYSGSSSEHVLSERTASKIINHFILEEMVYKKGYQVGILLYSKMRAVNP